ncbi:EamA family transporter [Rugosimonospora acidiphila]|uniref:EamA family transporter n=1 Tax=Rugosimonospora acidiphila TaxID=556531 RepID=A0ABP9SWW5_9ACTN
MSRRGWLLFMAMGLIWGVPYLLIKVSVGVLSPVSLVFLRTGLGALLLLPLAGARGQLRPLLRHWPAVLVFTAAEVAVPWLLLASAEQRLDSSLSGLLIAAVPLFGALLAWASGTERPGGMRLTGLLVGLVGVAALVGLDVHGGDLRALVEMAGVVIGYAVGPYVLARYLSDVPGAVVTAVSLGLTALVYLPVAVFQLPRHWPSARVTGAVVVLAVLCTAAAFLLFVALIAEVGPVRATVVTYVNPAVAVALGVLLLDEPFTLGIGLGFALVLAGSVLATRRAPRPDPVPEPEPVSAG